MCWASIWFVTQSYYGGVSKYREDSLDLYAAVE
jgi:hypothetical protein